MGPERQQQVGWHFHPTRLVNVQFDISNFQSTMPDGFSPHGE
jgi:hypothetical protein